MIVFALAISGAMFGASGAADVWGSETPQTDAAEDALDEQASQNNPNPNDKEEGPIAGPVSSGDSDIVGLIANGLGSIAGIAAAVAALPTTLVNLHIPGWFASAVSPMILLLASIGVIQWATNRYWK